MSPAQPRRRQRAHRAPAAAGSSAPGATRRASARAPILGLHASATPSAATERWLWRLTLAACGLLGLALLAMVFGPHRVGDYMTETDFYGQYADGARAILRGHLDPSRYGVVGPVYEVTLALAGIVVRDLFLAAGLLSVVSAVGTLWLWAALLRRRAAAGLALATVLFLATNGTFFRYGFSVTTDALALALQAATLCVLLTRTGPGGALGAGALAALAFLTRYNAGVLLPAGLVAIAAGGTLQPRRARAALLFAAGFLLPVLPWVLYSIARGTGVSFQLHHNIAYEVFARAKGIPWDEYQRTMQPQFHSLADVIARDPGAVAARMGANVLDHLRQDLTRLTGAPVAACAALGLALALADRALRRLWPLALAWALLFLALVPVFYSERYSLALLPFYAAAAAALFASPRFALVLQRGPRPWLKPALALLPLALATTAAVKVHTKLLGQLPVEVLAAARTLRAAARPGDRVIARKGHIAFHSGLGSVPFPFVDSLPQLAAWARAHDARWLYFSWPEAETRPSFWYLLDTTGVVPGLTPMPFTTVHPAVLYRIGADFGRVPAWATNDTLKTLHMARAHAMVYRGELMQYGRLAVTLGHLAEGREAYEQAAVLQPRNALLQVALGMVCVRLGDLPPALAAFERAEELDPASLDARIGHGWALVLAGRTGEAAGVWRPVVALTRDSDTLRRMIALYQALGDREAESRARAALALTTGAR